MLNKQFKWYFITKKKKTKWKLLIQYWVNNLLQTLPGIRLSK